MCGHLSQLWQYAIYVLIRIHECDNNREIAASLNEMSCTHFVSAKEPSDGMKHHRSSNILFAQVPENFQVQGPVMP